MADRIELEPVSGLRITWDLGGAGTYARGETDACWRHTGDVTGSLRVLTAAGGEGGLLLLASVRSANAPGHDAERIAAVLASTDEAPRPVHETLISTEYTAAGAIRRIGLEIYLPGEDYALRAAGDAITTGASSPDGTSLAYTTFDFRLDGQAGAARLDLVDHPA